LIHKSRRRCGARLENLFGTANCENGLRFLYARDESYRARRSGFFASGTLLYALSLTNAINVRLAAFYHWGDRHCFDQALSVARQNRDDVDLAEIERWSRAEGSPEKYVLFLLAID